MAGPSDLAASPRATARGEPPTPRESVGTLSTIPVHGFEVDSASYDDLALNALSPTVNGRS